MYERFKLTMSPPLNGYYKKVKLNSILYNSEVNNLTTPNNKSKININFTNRLDKNPLFKLAKLNINRFSLNNPLLIKKKENALSEVIKIKKISKLNFPSLKNNITERIANTNNLIINTYNNDTNILSTTSRNYQRTIFLTEDKEQSKNSLSILDTFRSSNHNLKDASTQLSQNNLKRKNHTASKFISKLNLDKNKKENKKSFNLNISENIKLKLNVVKLIPKIKDKKIINNISIIKEKQNNFININQTNNKKSNLNYSLHTFYNTKKNDCFVINKPINNKYKELKKEVAKGSLKVKTIMNGLKLMQQNNDEYLKSYSAMLKIDLIKKHNRNIEV